MEITKHTQQELEQVERLEDAYNTFNSTDIPNWGAEQEDAKGRMADELIRAYDLAGIPDDERIAL